MKTPLHWFRILSFTLGLLAVQTGGRAQDTGPLRMASDAEALAGTAVRAFVTPDQVASVLAAGGVSGPTNGIPASTATNIVNGAAGVIQTNGAATTFKFTATGTNVIQTLATNAPQILTPTVTGGIIQGAAIFTATNTSPGIIFSDYDLAAEDLFVIRHAGSEFFLGLTNGGFQSFIDFNDQGEAEFNIPTSNFYRFYTRNAGVDTVRFQIGDAGATGDGSGLTNLNVGRVIAGANIGTSYSKDPVTGKTNTTLSVSDPMNEGQVNAGIAWLTNSVTPTNTMGGTAIDFSTSESRSNIAGNVTFSSVANLTAGAYNRKVIHLANASGSDRTLSLATGWGVGLNDTFVITNGTRMDLWAECEPGIFTNVFQKQIPIH